MAMKLTTGILAVAMVVSGSAATKVAAQNADAIDNARSTAKSLQQNQPSPAPKAAATSAAAKPAPGAPAPAVKPAAIPGSKPVAVAVKPAPASKPVSTSSSSHNQLQKVNVVPGANGFQIEISSSQAVTPRVSKLNSPARVVVELPETVVASAQNKIPVGSAGVKGVRIGMDGKNPPTTSVVVDLEKPLTYELTPGPAGKVILTLHTQDGTPSVAKNSLPAAVKTTAAPAVKTSSTAVVKTPAPAPKATIVPAKAAVTKAPAAKPVAQATKPEPELQAKAAPASKIAAVSAPVAAPTKPAAAVGNERQTRSVLQSGCADKRLGLFHRKEVPGDWRNQPARRSEVRRRFYRSGDQQSEQSIFSAGERSRVQRLRGEDHG
ncbi:MAG: hypothetical protein DMG79_09035 [Acidobacteria bacterium]|nr:MAG: hypothetical protein DMG79_09035 [Acidobacteriota bacterium]